MEIGHFLKTGIELSYFSHTDTGVLSEKSETFGVSMKGIEISEVFIDSIHWFLFGCSNEKNGSISTLDSIFLGWWLVVWNRVSYFDITYREWNVQWCVNFFWNLSSLSNWLWGCGNNWLWSSFNDWLWSGNGLWFSKVLIIGLGKFLILIFSKLSSLNINKLYIVNFLSHSQVGWSSKGLG